QVPRPAPERALRWALKEGLPSPLFAPAMKLGQAVRGLLPAGLQAKVPAPRPAGPWPRRVHDRKVLLLAGCAQPAMSPRIDAATARVLDAIGVQALVAPQSGCCGAVQFHLNDQDGGRARMRANIDAWWPYVEPASDSGVEALLMNASGCGVTVKEYGHILRDDPQYAARAARVSAMTRDLSEWLPELTQRLRGRVRAPADTVAFHPPCTLQHGQKLRGGVEQHLRELGFDIRITCAESHLCCGSAGTYSVLNPELATQLRDRKLGHLGQTFGEAATQTIASANIGCITHLQSGTDTPVRHWIELLDEALPAG
ncbi:MAG: glycolate oxidase subunit GlcF, partial [Rhodoferax sp.]|nr:glycolate oxidase subunit GlcF [Rhodoferax sp.]